MTHPSAARCILAGLGLLVWLALIVLPLAGLYGALVIDWPPADQLWSFGTYAALVARSALLAAGVALAAVLLGLIPARVFAAARNRRTAVFWLLLAPLLLPAYVLFYIWSLLMSPTTALGSFLGSQQSVALSRWVGTLTSSAAQVLWYWPLAALVIGQGWRAANPELWESARLDAGPWRQFTRVTLPVLARPLVLAFAVCFTLVIAEFGAFHLAGVRTLGTELGVLYEATGSSTAVARAALPLVALAAGVVFLVSRNLPTFALGSTSAESPLAAGKWRWAFFVLLVLVSLAAPIGLLIANLDGVAPLRQFWSLQWDGLRTSLAAAGLAAGLALVLAAGALAMQDLGRLARAVALIMQATILFAVFLPGSLVGVAMIHIQSALGLPQWLGQGWWAVSAGQAARFAGLALLLLMLARESRAQHYSEMAAVDGAGAARAWWHVHLPLVWPAALGAGVLAAVFSLTELPATMVLLPPGVPNFTQRLLNQMHYARDQQVIVSCLLLLLVYLLLAGAVALLRGLVAVRAARGAAALVVCAALVCCAGCDSQPSAHGEPNVRDVIGSTGAGPGEFRYPRAIDLDADGNLYVADKTGRIQHLSPRGEVLGTITLPAFELGYPTGLTVAPDGRLFVADTHYHRVLIYDAAGALVGQFGQFGTGDGQFIYPTDVAIADDGRILVSEYGGNDRVSIYTPQCAFVKSFGRPGEGSGEFSRPAALCLDRKRNLLYVADACNHRIAKYTLEGELLGYLGAAGQEPGQLRYPYGLALLPSGVLVVSEYGNNRLQLLADDGRSRACLGGPGRRTGQLAFPWGVAVDRRLRAYVVDAGNNRIQIWQL